MRKFNNNTNHKLATEHKRIEKLYQISTFDKFLLNSEMENIISLKNIFSEYQNTINTKYFKNLSQLNSEIIYSPIDYIAKVIVNNIFTQLFDNMTVINMYELRWKKQTIHISKVNQILKYLNNQIFNFISDYLLQLPTNGGKYDTIFKSFYTYRNFQGVSVSDGKNKLYEDSDIKNTNSVTQKLNTKKSQLLQVITTMLEIAIAKIYDNSEHKLYKLYRHKDNSNVNSYEIPGVFIKKDTLNYFKYLLNILAFDLPDAQLDNSDKSTLEIIKNAPNKKVVTINDVAFNFPMHFRVKYTEVENENIKKLMKKVLHFYLNKEINE